MGGGGGGGRRREGGSDTRHKDRPVYFCGCISVTLLSEMEGEKIAIGSEIRVVFLEECQSQEIRATHSYR